MKSATVKPKFNMRLSIWFIFLDAKDAVEKLDFHKKPSRNLLIYICAEFAF